MSERCTLRAAWCSSALGSRWMIAGLVSLMRVTVLVDERPMRLSDWRASTRARLGANAEGAGGRLRN